MLWRQVDSSLAISYAAPVTAFHDSCDCPVVSIPLPDSPFPGCHQSHPDPLKCISSGKVPPADEWHQVVLVLDKFQGQAADKK